MKARAAERKANEQRKLAQAKASERLDKALAKTTPLTDKQREQALADVELIHGKYSVEGMRLIRQLTDPGEEEVEAA